MYETRGGAGHFLVLKKSWISEYMNTHFGLMNTSLHIFY